ncbi:hypothetical protein EDB19DRAFT_1833110 [Suillus lakei]|nr:hypothetical protein EDB19DRAFT_1833110 [Suillus lakei]
MPPWKGKGKQNTAESSTMESNAFRLDTRPVEAKVNNNNQAAKIQCLDAALEKVKIGIGKLDLLQMENKIVFGTYNDHLKKSMEVNKMLTSFENNGLQWSKCLMMVWTGTGTHQQSWWTSSSRTPI